MRVARGPRGRAAVASAPRAGTRTKKKQDESNGGGWRRGRGGRARAVGGNGGGNAAAPYSYNMELQPRASTDHLPTGEGRGENAEAAECGPGRRKVSLISLKKITYLGGPLIRMIQFCNRTIVQRSRNARDLSRASTRALTRLSRLPAKSCGLNVAIGDRARDCVAPGIAPTRAIP